MSLPNCYFVISSPRPSLEERDLVLVEPLPESAPSELRMLDSILINKYSELLKHQKREESVLLRGNVYIVECLLVDPL